MRFLQNRLIDLEHNGLSVEAALVVKDLADQIDLLAVENPPRGFSTI
jgi:hypothetical protein